MISCETDAGLYNGANVAGFANVAGVAMVNGVANQHSTLDACRDSCRCKLFELTVEP